MIDLDKFLSLFYERDDPVMCYVWICVLCAVCFVCFAWCMVCCVWFGLIFFSFLLTFGHLFCFLSFPFYFCFFSWVGWFGRRRMEGDGMGYKANSATGYHIYPFSIDISDNYRHDYILFYTQCFECPKMCIFVVEQLT